MTDSKVQKVKIADLVLDYSLYPRTMVSRVDVNRYADALRAGRSLPPIVVDADDMQVLDGFHRVEAHKKLKLEEITVELRHYESKADAWLDASLSTNARHGRSLTPYDIKRSVRIAEDLGVEREKVAEVTNMSPERFDRVVSEEASYQGRSLPLKRGLGSFRGRDLTQRQADLNRKWGGMNVLFYVRQVADYLEAGGEVNEETSKELDRLASLWGG